MGKLKTQSLLIDNILSTSASQARGLMFSKPQNLVFAFKKEGKYPIHMLFVFFSIYAIWLDAQKCVIDIQKANPFHPYITHKQQAKYLIELPVREFQKYSISIGDTVDWKLKQ